MSGPDGSVIIALAVPCLCSKTEPKVEPASMHWKQGMGKGKGVCGNIPGGRNT
jgi:hypothetical protein